MQLLREHPQLRLMFSGMLLSTIGGSMIWPFLMIYVSGKLALPLSQITFLLALSSVSGLISSLIVGPIVDRLGRKSTMVLSMLIHGGVYLLLGQAHSLFVFAILMTISGATSPLYRIGGDAMLADLITSEKRPEAYALMRMSNNVGIAIGPAVGGFIATTSYTVAFLCAAGGLSAYSLLMAVFGKETLPTESRNASPKREPFGGYDIVLRDKQFIFFISSFLLTQICAVLVWVLMGVYAKTNFGIPENQYGLIATTNALMVVFLQFAVTQLTKRHLPTRMMALGALFYGLGVGSVALAQGFWGFWISMVIVTIGELILAPTSSTYAANLAPADMRGRYLGLYGLSWPIASGIASITGGFLHDYIAPTAPWYGGMLAGIMGMLMFLSQKTTVKSLRNWDTKKKNSV